MFPCNCLWIGAIDKYSNLKCKRDHKPNNKSTTTILWNYKKTHTKKMLLMLSLQIEWSHNSFHILFAYSIQQEYGHSLGKWSQRIIFELLKFHARSFLLTYKIQIHARPESFKGIFNFKELQVEVLSYVLYRNKWLHRKINASA